MITVSRSRGRQALQQPVDNLHDFGGIQGSQMNRLGKYEKAGVVTHPGLPCDLARLGMRADPPSLNGRAK